MPAHAKDAQVNRQLSNIVSLSLELGRLLKTDGDADAAEQSCLRDVENETVEITGHDGSSCSPIAQQTNKSPGIQSVTAIPKKSTKLTTVQVSPACNKNNQDSSETENPGTTLRKTCQPKQVHMAVKIVADSRQTTLTQICDEATFSKTDTDSDSGTPKTPNMKKPTSSGYKSSENTKSVDEENSKPKRRGRCRGLSSTPNDVFTMPTPSPPSSNSNRRSRNSSEKTETRSSPSTRVRKNGDQMPSSTPPTTTNTPTSTVKSTPKNSRRKSVDPEHETPRSAQAKRRSMPSVRTPMRSSTSRASPASTPSTPAGGRLCVNSKVKTPCTPNTPAGRRLSMNGKVKTPSTKRNAKGETPLHVAAIKGDLTAVKQLLTQGDNPNVRDNAGWTPLHEAVNHGHTAVAEALLQHGAMVNTPGMDNDTPLHDAVLNGRLECVRLLLSYGASVSARNIHGKTVLDLATSSDIQDALNQPTPVQPQMTDITQLEEADEVLQPCFIGTGLNRDQQKLLQKCATMLHAKIVEDISMEVTHVISSVNADGQCPRTFKYLSAVLAGKWIVNMDWVNICLEYGEKVPEEPFEIPGCSTHPNSYAPHEARINHKLQLPPLFDGCQVYLHGSFTRLPPNKPELADLLQLGGAHILTREPRLSNLDDYETTVPYHAKPGSSLVDCGIFIVCDEDSKVHKVEAHRMRTVPASWVVECIATFSLVEPSVVHCN